MELEKLLEEPNLMSLALAEKPKRGNADLTRAAQLEISRETYFEAQNQGLTLSELLETEPYDPSPVGAALDAFDRQLIVRGLKTSGKNASTVEEFFAAAPILMPEFIRREILRGQRMRPGLETLSHLQRRSSLRATRPFTSTSPRPKRGFRSSRSARGLPFRRCW